MDLLLIDPNGGSNFDGASLNNPEQVAVSNPLPGTWFAIVSGYTIHTGTDKFEFDGKVK